MGQGLETANAWRNPLFGGAAFVAYLVLILAFLGDPLVTRVYYLRQDWIGGVVLVLGLLAAAFWQGGPRLPAFTSAMPRLLPVAGFASILVLALWAGTHLVMLDYPLTRDELMAVFDSQVFAKGYLAEPVAVEWRDFLSALVPEFYLQVGGNAAVVSNYMPGNAAMRAVAASLGSASLLNPLLAGIGLVAIWDCARRVFSDCPQAVWLVLVGYVLSAQVLVNAMTAYAMTGHMVFSAIWLMLFLRDRWWSHAAAMAVAVWAMGLHQVAFHPLFAGPVILTLLVRKRFGLFVAYAAVYAAALIGWTLYPGFVLSSSGVTGAAGAGGAGTGSFLADRVVPLVTNLNPYALPLMMYNVLRFLVWNAAFALPLALWAVRAARRREWLAVAFFASLIGTVATVTLVMAYQGHGWGYRYWHAILPGILLLCGFGFREWYRSAAIPAERGAVILGATSLLLLPFLLIAANRFVAPYAALSAMIGRQQADFVILETDPPGSAIDQVRNRADLTNRPLVFASGALTQDKVDELCRRGSVTFLRKRYFSLIPFNQKQGDNRRAYDQAEDRLKSSTCWRPVVR